MDYGMLFRIIIRNGAKKRITVPSSSSLILQGRHYHSVSVPLRRRSLLGNLMFNNSRPHYFNNGACSGHFSSSSSIPSTSVPQEEKIRTEEEINNTDKVEEAEYEDILSTLPHVPRQSRGRTFLDIWINRNKNGRIRSIQWPSLIRKCLEIDNTLNPSNFGGVLMMFCKKNDAFSIAQDYMKWEEKPALGVLSGYLRLLTENRDPKEKGYIPEILQIYDKLKKKMGGGMIWDRDSGDRAISALSQTSRWREAEEILGAIKVGSIPYTTSYGSIASAAFKNGEFELGWNYLNQVGYRSLLEEPLIRWLENCEPTESNITKVLEYMDLYDYYPTSKIIREIKYLFETKLKYKGYDTSIIPGKGICRNCRTPLERSHLTQEEFETLRDHFFSSVLMEGDVFLNTTPGELEDYKKFIDKSSPYDFVLDGLNISYSCGKGRGSPALILEQFVNHLHQSGHKILVIGRNHMLKWRKDCMNNVRRMADLYLINDQSQDDPFLIWATFKSGMKAQFVSKDFLRNHSFRLQNPEMARLFKRWRLSHQKSPVIMLRGRDTVIRLDAFTEVVPVPQKSEEHQCWHIPYDMDKITSPYDIPKKWLCLTYNAFRNTNK